MTITSEVAAAVKLTPAPQGTRTCPAKAVIGVEANGRILDRRAFGLQRMVVLARLAAFARSWHDFELDGERAYADAESALREILRKSPHGAEARMMLARALAGRGDVLNCARQLHEVPFWSPLKAEALYREGQAYLQIDRAKNAEAAWLAAIEDDPLHPVKPDLFHDICQGLLNLYAIEDRWEDAYPVMWTAYDHVAPVDQPVLLTMRMRPELERVSPKESIAILGRYVAADADDWEARRSLARAEQALSRPAEAARHFQVCLAGGRDDVRAWRDYLAMLLEEGELDAFLSVLNEASQIGRQ